MSEPTWELLGGGGVVGGPIDYVGAWAAGTTYQPGQVVRYGGIDYLSVNPSLGQIPPASTGFGAYQAYTPVLAAESVIPALGAGYTQGRYCRIGNHVHYLGKVSFGTGMSAGSGTYIVSLPVAPNLTAPEYRIFGTVECWQGGQLALASAATDPGAGAGSSFYMTYPNTSPIGPPIAVSHGAPWGWASGGEFYWNLTYEAAA